jgi:membrane protease YdiL (CAAX protease family)
MRDWVRSNPFLSFYVLAVAFPTVLFAYLIFMEASFPDFCGPGISLFRQFNANMSQLLVDAPYLTQHRDSVLVYLTLYAMLPLAAPFLFFPFGPTVSALVVTGLARGGAAVRALLGAYAPKRGSLSWPQALRLYGLLLALLVCAMALVVLGESLLNGGERLPQFTRVWALADWKLFAAGWLAALFTNQGGLLEELGWRGYAWPLLVRRFRSPLLAAVLLGIAWALWHLPREVLPIAMGQFSLPRFLVDEALFVVGCIGMTIVAVTFVNLTGGSVLPAIMIHGTLNYLFAGFEAGRSGVRSDIATGPVIFWVVAGLVTLLYVGRDLGWKRRLELHGGDGSTDPANLWAGSPQASR